jgi:hypothetical protein
MVCALSDRIGTHPKFIVLGAKGQIQGIHSSPTPLSLILLSVDYSTSVITLLGGCLSLTQEGLALRAPLSTLAHCQVNPTLHYSNTPSFLKKMT